MQAYKCDCCGKLYERYKPYVTFDSGRYYKLKIVLDASDRFVKQDVHLDMCPECFAKIANQIECLRIGCERFAS